MEEEEEVPSPFWLQNTHSRRRRRHSSSLFLNPGLLLVLLLVIAILFIFIVIPSFLSFTSQIFRPHLVKKNWDSLNLVLVLFAIVCGFLSRNTNNNENTSSYEDASISSSSQESHKSTPSTSNQWYNQYSDRTADSYSTINRLRSSSSYPDLRQESTWVSHNERWRFYDDTNVSGNYRFQSSDQLHHRHPTRDQPQEEEEEGNLETKNIPRDTFVVPAVEEDALEPKNIHVDAFVASTEEVPSYKSPSPPLPSSPPPQPSTPPSPLSPFTPPKVVKHRKKRTYQTLAHNEKTGTPEKIDSQVKNLRTPPSPPPLPRPPPSPPPVFQQVEQRSGDKNEKKRGGSATKDFLSSLRRKKKKQRQKSVENFDTFLNSQPSSSTSHPLYPPPPPPPPLPPPPSVFHSLFSSKKGKAKKLHSVPPPPPPTPPQPQAKVWKPPLPVKTRIINSGDENVSSGNESPLNPIPPPPPPPPPFKMQPWKFEVQGDYVRIKSNNSSRSGSPDPMDGGESPTKTMFCPSPDVDTKADSFIAKFRADLLMQKMNSFKEKQGRGRSNLGPERSPK